jgi:hypothetical protein
MPNANELAGKKRITLEFKSIQPFENPTVYQKQWGIVRIRRQAGFNSNN